MLSYRQRGRRGLWYARGTIRVGRETVPIAEYCTGEGRLADAQAVAEADAARLREDILSGDRGGTRRLTIADALEAYLGRPGGVESYDVERVAAINAAIGGRPLAEARPAWAAFVATRAWAPATARRWRSIYVAALRTLAEARDIDAPRIPTVARRRTEKTRVVVLPDALRERLVAAYHPTPAAPILLLAFQGMRTQESLQLDWREVDLPRAQLRLVARKTFDGRTIPMHRRVQLLLWGMWEAAGRPSQGPVFRSRRGRPYADTKGQGGNPLKRAHESACRRVGLSGFRVHDWRHDFAVRFLRSGGDVRALMDQMGWEDIRMVKRYVRHAGDRLADIMRQVA